jgi:hypothetical protein
MNSKLLSAAGHQQIPINYIGYRKRLQVTVETEQDKRFLIAVTI